MILAAVLVNWRESETKNGAGSFCFCLPNFCEDKVWRRRVEGDVEEEVDGSTGRLPRQSKLPTWHGVVEQKVEQYPTKHRDDSFLSTDNFAYSTLLKYCPFACLTNQIPPITPTKRNKQERTVEFDFFGTNQSHQSRCLQKTNKERY